VDALCKVHGVFSAFLVNLQFIFGNDSSMAAIDVGSSSSSEEDLYHLKPPSWKRQSAVPVIDKLIPDGHHAQNLEPDEAKNIACNNGKVLLSEKNDISKGQIPSVEISVLDTSSHTQKLPLNVSDQISNENKELQATGVTSPTSAKSCIVMSDQLQGRHSNMQDAVCQTVLTGEFLEGLGSLEKVRDVGSQTVGTGDVISLNVFCGDLCNSDFKLPNSTCDPVSDGLYNHITLKEIENCVNVLQEQILQ